MRAIRWGMVLFLLFSAPEDRHQAGPANATGGTTTAASADVAAVGVTAPRGTAAPVAAVASATAGAPGSARAPGDSSRAAPLPAATLSRATVPAANTQSAILGISRFGRYALTVASRQGMSLRVVDRMAGPGDIHGVPGENDGRADLFLDRGEYKIILDGPEHGTGQAKLAVQEFREKNGPKPTMLVELRPIDASLDDIEQLSWWLRIEKRRHVRIEAAGRNLADLRLWQNGTWLVDADPAPAMLEPRTGHPLAARTLDITLETGLYLLTAYGGPALPWSEDDSEHPFHLRFGVPKTGAENRRHLVAGPFGTERWIVPARANYFRLELAEARQAVMTVGDYDESTGTETSGRSVAIVKETNPPVVEIDLGENASEDGLRLLTVNAEEGQSFVLQYFEKRSLYTFQGSGDRWISSIHSGDPADSVDATAIVTRSDPHDPREPSLWKHTEPFVYQTVDVDSAHGWARRANLTATLTIFMHLSEARRYEVITRGVEARHRIEPFMTTRPEKYETPPLKPSGSTWDLDAGFWVLTLEPEQVGIVEVAVRPSGLLDRAWDMLGRAAGVAEGGPRPSVRFPSTHLEANRWYTMYLNQQPEVRAGLVLRSLPVNLAEPLPLAQSPAEPVEIPVRLDESGAVRAEAEDGSFLPISVNGGLPGPRPILDAGTYTLSITPGGSKPVVYSLIFTPRRLDPAEPLPPLPETALAGLPQFPVLTPREPRALDLEREARATFLVQADKPALYRLESRGLIATEGNVRTRTLTSFDRAAENGTGRNFLVLQYMREGDYQLTVQARGQSRGHLAVALSEAPLTDGGLLSDGIPARATLGPGEAVLYNFTIPEAADYRIQALGRDRTFRCRLEDADGWPIEKPNIQADLVRRLEPGSYRLVLLPDAVGTRAVTGLAKVPEPVRLEGHGPHTLPLDQKFANTWTEPQGRENAGNARNAESAESAGSDSGRTPDQRSAVSDAARPPDRWEFTIPAPVAVRIELTGEMQGVLRRLDGSGAGAGAETKVNGGAESGTSAAASVDVTILPPGRGWAGNLDAGRYALEAVCSRRNNRAVYEVAVWSASLVDGLTKTVTAPGSIAVSVGREALVELTSSGAADVRARLLDASGRTVAVNDDRPDDWNFRIAEHLPPGRYSLEIDPVGKAGAETKVSMLVPAERAMVSLSLPARREMTLGADINILSLEIPRDADFLVASARAAENLALSIERSDGRAWRTVGTATGRTVHLEAPIQGGSSGSRTETSPAGAIGAFGPVSYRLRLWSVDRRGSRAILTAAAVKPETFSESRLDSGLALRPVAGIEPPVVAGAVRLDKPGTFRLRDGPITLRVSADPLHACAAVDGGVVSAVGDRLYMAADAADAAAVKGVTGVTADTARVSSTAKLGGGAKSTNDTKSVGAANRAGPVRTEGTTDTADSVKPDGTAEKTDTAKPGGGTIATSHAKSGGGTLVKATRVRLGGKGPRTVNLRISPDAPSALDIEGGNGVVAIVRSLAGQPGARITGAEIDPLGAPVEARGSWTVGAKSAVAVWLGAGGAAVTPGAGRTIPSNQKTLTVWRAGSGVEPLDARVETFALSWRGPGSAGNGITSGDIAGNSSRALSLPEGPKRIRLVLDEGTLAVLASGQEIESTHWGASAPLDETFESSASQLVLIRPKPGTGRYFLESYAHEAVTSPVSSEHLRSSVERDRGGSCPEDAHSLALAAGSPYAGMETVSGTLRLRVSAARPASGGPASVHVRGAQGEAVLVRDDGTVGRGDDIPLGAAGCAQLLVPHDASWVFAWIDRPGEEARDLWGDVRDIDKDAAGAMRADGIGAMTVTRGAAATDADVVRSPAIVQLGGRPSLLRFEPAHPVIVHVRAPGPAITMLTRGSDAPEVRLHASSVSLDAWLPAGPSSLRLRAPGKAGLAELEGSAEISFDAVTPIREGLGPELLLPAGGSRAFSFTTTRKGPVGLGVRASSDLLACELQDASGHALADGFVMMRELDPGTYLLWVRVPAGAAPVRLRPALAGIELPDTGPPAEVVRGYIEGRSPSDARPAARARPRPGAAEGEEPGEDERPEGNIPEGPPSEEGD